MYSISRLFNISPATLMALNHLAPPANLAVGQVLLVKEQQPQTAAQAPAATPTAKAAAPARPAAAVAQPAPVPASGRPVKHHAPVLYVPKKVAAGAAPTVAAKPATAVAAAPTMPSGNVTQHTVAKGETLYSIARLYNVKVADLKAWNAKADDNAKVGEVLRVQPSGK